MRPCNGNRALAPMRTSARIDLDGSRHSGDKLNAFWNGVNADMHRHALREANRAGRTRTSNQTIISRVL
jgi:hypothetical protein